MSVEPFRGGTRPTLGVELELQLVDPRTFDLVAAADAVMASVPDAFRESVKPEFYPSCVEINTGICQDVASVGLDLGPKLAAVAEVAARHGARLAWGGTHPFAHWLDQPITPDPRYLELANLLRETLCRQLTFGLHVHVGVPDGDAAVRACNGIVEHLPTLLALSANSPFWCGRPTGLKSHRVEVMGASPTGGLPPHLDGWDAYVGVADRLAGAGFIETTKELWWDVRPSERHGTVEVRICDMPPDLPSVLGLAALIQCLVDDLARGRHGGPPPDDCGLLMIRQNRWRAARYGLGAVLVDWRTGRPSPAPEVIKGLVDRMSGIAEALGCAREMNLVRRMADGPGGADRQLAVFERTGDLVAVARLQAGDPASEPGHPVAASQVRDALDGEVAGFGSGVGTTI
jgi:carboxylate-amine ligase